MKIETKDGITYITAEDGFAIHRIGTAEPSNIVKTQFEAGHGSESDWEDCELGEPSSTLRFSVRSVIRELKAAGKYAAVRQLLETTGYDWEFVGSNYLASDDADFAAMCAGIVTAGIATQAELDALLEKCAWSAE